MKNSTYTGINIQYPISIKIISGQKTIETRTYPLPEKYLNKEMALIETPGNSKKFKSRITAIIKFINCKEYKSKSEFYKDRTFHLVEKRSKWDWKDKRKFGWELTIVKIFETPIPFNKPKGIVYTKNIKI